MKNEFMTKQFLFTPLMGKRLIAKSIVANPKIKQALTNNTIVIIGGTTNGYVVEELLKEIDSDYDFDRENFYRGIVLAPPQKLDINKKFEEDIIIEKGNLVVGKTIYDVVGKLKLGDVVIKGANAVNLDKRQAGIYIGHPNSGVIGVVNPAVYGRRVDLVIPVGVEKRIPGDINEISLKLNKANSKGLRMFPVCGDIVTEIEAIKMLTDAEAEIVAAGGVNGAEGGCWFAVSGTDEQIKSLENIISEIN